jgi:hypothetical protein
MKIDAVPIAALRRFGRSVTTIRHSVRRIMDSMLISAIATTRKDQLNRHQQRGNPFKCL